MGGLSKKAFQLNKLRRSSAAPHLTVDGGALLFKHDKVFPGRQEMERVTAEGIVKAYNLMRYDAVGVGRQDLAAGLPFFLKLRSKSKFTWLSANLVRKSDRQPLVSPFMIKKTGKLKVGIIGLTGTGSKQLFTTGNDAMVLGWEEVLPDIVNKVKSKCDFLVLLSNLQFPDNKKIAEQFPAIHLVVQSQQNSTSMEPQLHNNTLICQTAKQGKYLGKMQITWQPSHLWGTDTSDQLLRKKQELDRVNWQLKRMEQRGDPDVVYKSFPERLKAHKRLSGTQRRLKVEIKALEEKMQQERQQGMIASSFDNHFLAMDLALPDDRNVLNIVEETRKKVNALGQKRAAEKTRQPQRSVSKKNSASPLHYVGWKTCSSCHREQEKAWRRSGHFRAYQTLVAQKQQFNLDCIPCHVTGVVSGNEPYALSLDPGLRQVGCEACHGPGKKHVSNPPKWPLPSRPAAAICLRCHTPERDDNFKYDTDVHRLGCPASSDK